MQLKTIISHLESIAPLSLQEPYDNSGLITGNPEIDINGVLICLDCTEDVIEETLKKKCELIIAHHPIVFTGLKKFTGADYVQRTLIKALKNDISIYAFHTNLDNISTGVNAKICNLLGLKNTRILAPKAKLLMKLLTFCPVDKADKVRQALFSAGCGHIGNYDECSFNVKGYGTFRALEGSNPYAGTKGKQHRESEIRIEAVFPEYLKGKILRALFEAHPYEEVAYDIISLENDHAGIGSGMIGELAKEEAEIDFLRKIKKRMRTDCIRHTKLLDKKIKKVAVCGGSGGFLLKNAIAAGADILISSDFKYHQFFDADKKIIVADIGHYESEQYTIELIGSLLIQKFSTFAIRFSDINTNPVFYL